MERNKAMLVKKYRHLLKKSGTKESEFEEVEHKLSEDARESEEGLGIEKEEDAGEEAYPEVASELEHEDNPDKEDE